MSVGNGNSERPSLAMLGAPHWYVEGERLHDARHNDLCARVEKLEAAMIEGAKQHGAKAGRKWGMFLGTLFAVAGSTALNHCTYQDISHLQQK